MKLIGFIEFILPLWLFQFPPNGFVEPGTGFVKTDVLLYCGIGYFMRGLMEMGSTILQAKNLLLSLYASMYGSIFQILKLQVDSLFVIDYDAIRHRYLNLKLYSELSKFFELTIMVIPVST